MHNDILYCLHNEGQKICSLLACTKRATSFVLCSSICPFADSVTLLQYILEWCCGLHLTHYCELVHRLCLVATQVISTSCTYVTEICAYTENVVYLIFQDKSVVYVGHGILTEIPVGSYVNYLVV